MPTIHFTGSLERHLAVPTRDGAIYAPLNHRHFGVKLQRSGDDGRTWTEVAARPTL